MVSTDSRIALLEEWMRDKEGEIQEFKEAKASYGFRELAQYCCGIANEGGGRMILGVTNDRPRKVVGTAAFEQPERTRKGLCEKMALKFDFDEIMHPHGRVLVFHIPSRPIGQAIKYDGIYWSRSEDSLIPLTEGRLRSIFSEGGEDFSEKICDNLSFNDLDPTAIENFRRAWIGKVKKAGDSVLANRLEAFTPEQLLSDADAITPQGITYAALILFGGQEAVTRFLSQAEVIFEYRASDAPGSPQDRKEYRQGFLAFHNDLWNKINLRNERQSFQEGFFVNPIPTFSERTIREAILNAASHRNYQLGGSIFIRQYPRRLEVDSPGGFPFGITLQNIIDRQAPRNRRIAEIFSKCGLVDRSGQGMDLMFEESIRQGKPLPDFGRTDSYQVGITLHGNVQNPHFVRFVEKVGQEMTAIFSTHDWLVLALVSREERVPNELIKQAERLESLGLIEKIRGRQFILSRRYYEYVGKEAVYTRKRGLNREQNLTLLLNHIENNASRGGSKLVQLCEVLPSLKTTQVQSLLRTLKRRRMAYSVGKTNSAHWFPGTPSAESNDTNALSR